MAAQTLSCNRVMGKLMRLKNKVALVTGAGSMHGGLGNGKATAISFAREGARVCVVDIDQHAAFETKALIEAAGGTAIALKGDVSDEASMQDVVAASIAAFGHIDILHNNVGILKAGGAVETTLEDWDQLVHINMKAVFLPTKAVLPHFIERKSGCVINVSSIAGQRYLGTPYIAYNATKGSIISFTRNLAAEQAPNGIRANTILPGFIDTPMAKNAAIQKADDPQKIDWDALDRQRAKRIPLGRVGTPWDVANAAVFLASDEASYITGTEIIVDGGVTCQV